MAGSADWWYTSRMRGLALLSVLVVAACGPSKPAVDPSLQPKEDMSSDWTASAPPVKAETSESSSEGSSDAWGAPTSSASASGGSASSGSSKGGSTSTSKTAPSGAAPSAAPASHAATDSGPRVPASIGGAGYDRGSIEVVLKRAARQVKANCGAATDDNGSASGPWGKTTLTVKLGHNGHSKGGTIPAPFDGKATGNCAIKAFINLIYEPFGGGDADLEWPIEIVHP